MPKINLPILYPAQVIKGKVIVVEMLVPKRIAILFTRLINSAALITMIVWKPYKGVMAINTPMAIPRAISRGELLSLKTLRMRSFKLTLAPSIELKLFTEEIKINLFAQIGLEITSFALENNGIPHFDKEIFCAF